MVLPIVWEREAQHQLYELPDTVQERITADIEAMVESGIFGYGDDDTVIAISDEELGEIWRLKVKEERDSALDHRVFFDMVDGDVRILRIYHRDEAYC